MPKKTTKSQATNPVERFPLTRVSHAKETAEDYVEAIAELNESKGTCRGVDLAKLFCVTHVTVSKILARLQSEGLVQFEPYGPLALTSQGTKLAAYARKRHDIVLRFLRAIGISDEIAQVDAEGIEHHVSPETLEAFRKFADDASREEHSKGSVH
jgi:DtxR family transcriptional regulator, manganese transport regulator